MHSPDHSTKGTPSASCGCPHWPLTAGEYEGSGSLSFPFRGAFHLSLTVLVRYRSHRCFSLGEWSPQLPTPFLVERGTQEPAPSLRLVTTGRSPALVSCSNDFMVSDSDVLQALQPRPLLREGGLGFSRFARHYYGNLG